jgi:AcrR family transcriptional regulator
MVAKNKHNIVTIENKQELRSRETKTSIIRAAELLMETHGYLYMTIQNICATANVSTGTFYHHFEDKNDLLRNITMLQYAKHKAANADRLRYMNSLEKLIDIYSHYVSSFESNGIEFTSDYVTTKNQSLLARRKDVSYIAGRLALHSNQHQNPTWEVEEKFVKAFLEQDTIALDSVSISTYLYIMQAQADGYLTDQINSLDLFFELDMIMFGVVFSWCQSGGSFDIRDQVEMMISKYLGLYAGDKFHS